MDQPVVATASNLINHIERVALRVTDVERALRFYRDVAGLQVIDQSDDFVALGSGGGPALVTLSSDGVTGRSARSATGLYHTAIVYPDRQALGEALARIVKAGYQVGASDHWVSEALYVDDPDGNGVELYRDRPRDQWPAALPGTTDRIGIGLDPLDLRALLEEAVSGGTIGTDAPAGTRVGHVHLQVSDIAETIHFYQDILGLDLMASMAGQAAFFSSGGYHHHLGANVWNSRGQGPGAPNTVGLEHIVLRTDAGELGLLKDRLDRSSYVYTMEGEAAVVADPSEIELRFVPTVKPQNAPA